jgi:acyl-CoA synthetase (AMP-forming)/AMP-acid ligase II
VLISPVAFLQRPARWMQLLASNSKAYSAAPNFAFELVARKTSDDDMAGLDLSDALTIATGSERVHPATLRRFTQRFAHFNLREAVLRPSYGLAEAMVCVATRAGAQPPVIARFDSEKLTAGNAEPCESGGGTRWSATGCRVHRWSASLIPRRVSSVRREPSVRSGCTAKTSRWAIGGNLMRPKARSAEGLSLHRLAHP